MNQDSKKWSSGPQNEPGIASTKWGNDIRADEVESRYGIVTSETVSSPGSSLLISGRWLNVPAGTFSPRHAEFPFSSQPLLQSSPVISRSASKSVPHGTPGLRVGSDLPQVFARPSAGDVPHGTLGSSRPHQAGLCSTRNTRPGVIHETIILYPSSVLCGKHGLITTATRFLSTKCPNAIAAPKYVIAIAHRFTLF
jgi:hypothetical protein